MMPDDTESPTFAVALAYTNLAEAQIAVGEKADAQSRLYNALARLNNIPSTDEISNDERNGLKLRIDAMMEEAKH